MSNYLKLWIMGGLLSLSVIIAKQLIVAGIDPIYLAMLQATGSIVFLASFGTTGVIENLRRNVSYYLLASTLGSTIPQLVVFYSVEYVGASVAALAYAFPLFITFFLSHLVSSSKVERKALIYMLGAFSGSLLYLYKPDVMLFDSNQMGWLFVLCLAPITLSIANIYRSRYWPADTPIYHLALLTNVFSFGSYLLLAAHTTPVLPDYSILSYSVYAAILVFMLIAGIGQYLLFSLQKGATPSFVGQTGSITAFCGGALGFLFFQESYQLTTFLGSLLIIVGVAGFSRQQDLEHSRP